MDFTPEQINAIKKCVEWYYVHSAFKDIFVIGGFAGTGKSTIVNKIVEILRVKHNSMLFCALTGKAALVLRMKGLNTNTIHKTFYQTYKTNRGVKFRLKKKLDFTPQLIVIDEFSMVDQKILEDIRSFHVPIIGIGDPGQLPPIFGSNEFMRDGTKIDCFLTQLMRQDDSTGIPDLANRAREMHPIPYGQYKQCNVVSSPEFKDDILNFDCILCWKNQTRMSINKSVRALKGLTSKYPKKGEKLLCLRNNYNYNVEYKDIPIYITNGLVLVCTEDSELITSESKTYLKVVCKPDFDVDEEFVLKCYPEVFDQYFDDSEKPIFFDPMDDDEGDLVHLDFGYALTVHKSQGSEWNNVLVINEFKGSQLMYAKWLYTAITRAKKQVTVVKMI